MLAVTVVHPRANGGESPAASSRPRTLVAPPWKHTLGLDRVGQTHLDIYSGHRKHFSRPLGIAAMKHAFNDADGPDDDEELTVYGVNSGTGEVIYNTSRFSLGFFDGWESGRLVKPVGIAADRDGWVAVSDGAADQVVFLKNDANKLAYRQTVSLDDTDRPLRSPAGLAIENGRLYVADSGNDRLVVMNGEGSQIELIGTDEDSWRLLQPFGVAVMDDPAWNHYQTRFIVVTDSLNQRLCKLTLDGELREVKRFAEVSGTPGGFFFVAIDYYSNVYATDTLAGCVYKFDRYLNYLTRFGCGRNPGTELDSPRGIAIYRRFGQVFIAEREGASYFWIGTDIIGLSCEAEPREDGTHFHLQFLLSEQSITEISLEDEANHTIHRFDEKEFTPPGRVTRIYQLPSGTLPCSVAECKYYVTVTAKATYSSRKFLEVQKTVQIKIKD
jgi:hypothetical protein